jgi:hypothetical protein
MDEVDTSSLEAQQSAVAAGDPYSEPEASSGELQDLRADSPASGSPAVRTAKRGRSRTAALRQMRHGKMRQTCWGQDPGTTDSSQSPVPGILP